MIWTPQGDHVVFDRLETLTVMQPDNVTTFSVANALRLPSALADAPAGNVAVFGVGVRWCLWVIECASHPKINARLTDADGKHYRINTVDLTVSRELYEIESTSEAAEEL